MNRRRAIEQSRNRADRAQAARWLSRERLREEKKQSGRKRAFAAAWESKVAEEDGRHEAGGVE